MTFRDPDWIELTLAGGLRRGFRRSNISGHWFAHGRSFIEHHGVELQVREVESVVRELLGAPPRDTEAET